MSGRQRVLTADQDPNSAPTPGSAAGRWAIDPLKSVARFSMTYLVVATLRGSFGSVDGAIVIDEENPGLSAVTASIDATTVSTGIRLRDAHLRSGEFFDVERFPTMSFQSSRIEKVDHRNFRVVGDLTIRDITHEVALDTVYDAHEVDAAGARRAQVTATAVLSRREFGLGTRAPIETAGLIASDRVTVTLDISAVAADDRQLR